jgi:hypothetical protein
MPYEDETSPAVLLEQAMLYTKRELVILHGNPEQYGYKVTPKVLLALYNKALDLNDTNALECLVNKYDMGDLFGDRDYLPEVTPEQADAMFDRIYAAIKTVNPASTIGDDSPRCSDMPKDEIPVKRVYGGRKYHGCFQETENGVVFFLMPYLLLLPKKTLVAVLREAHPEYMVNGVRLNVGCMYSDQIARILVREPDTTANLCKILRHEGHTKHSLPIEDLKDLEAGKFIVLRDSRDLPQ